MLLWREVPPATTSFGALLTVVSGIYIVYREQREQTAASHRRASLVAVNVGEDARTYGGNNGHHTKRLTAVRQRTG
jgi:hypothetical protein